MSAENIKKQLPLFVDPNILPTGKHHISYSEWNIAAGNPSTACSWRHKLQYIDKLAAFEGNAYTSYGKAIHDAFEKYVKTRKMATAEEVEKYFFDLMAPIIDNLGTEDQQKELDLCKKFVPNIKDTLDQLPEWLETTFPGWKLHSAEFDLFEPIEKQTNIRFKGFIDLVLKVPKKERKNSKKKNNIRLSNLKENNTETTEPIEYDYWLCDWKTCSYFWTSDKRRDFSVQMQLILYKHYFSKIFNVDLKNIKTAFLLIRTNVPKTDNNRFELFQISAGEKTIERALQEVNVMVNSLRKRIFRKNRNACRWCVFKGKPECP